MKLTPHPQLRQHLDNASDRIAGFSGSWLFVMLHVLWFTLWLVLHLDINLLTLIVSLEAIFLSAFVLMSGNRTQARMDRQEELIDQHVNVTAKQHTEDIHANTALTKEIHHLVQQIHKRLPERGKDGKFIKAVPDDPQTVAKALVQIPNMTITYTDGLGNDVTPPPGDIVCQ